MEADVNLFEDWAWCAAALPFLEAWTKDTR
jgi:hypothetical protein